MPSFKKKVDIKEAVKYFEKEIEYFTKFGGSEYEDKEKKFEVYCFAADYLKRWGKFT